MRWQLLAILVLISAPAFAQDGSANLDSGKGTIKVKPGCGKNSQPLFGTWTFSAGTFTATTTGNPVLSGTSVAQGMSNKNFRLTFDGPSKALFDDAMESWATAVCGLPVTLSAPTTVSRFDLKLNKRRTRAKVTLKASGTGATSQGTGRGKYEAIVRGSWQDALP
jgi:hypothetical protein